jgi:RimJ/RimL family protein N-acetyltransferase
MSDPGPPVALRGATVVLRDPEVRDLEVFARWMAPGHRWQTLDGPYLPRPPVEPAQLERLRARIAAREFETPRTRLTVAAPDTGEMIGQVSWYWESVETDWVALGIALYDPVHWGKGLGTEALGLWTDHLFAQLPRIVRLGLRTWSGNVGMMRVAQRLGFVEEARFRKARIVDGEYYDAMGYGVLREEWAARWPGGFR